MPDRSPWDQLDGTIVDRVVSYFSPRAGLKRAAARYQLGHAGRTLTAYGYTGGGRDRKSMQAYNPAAGSANADYLPQATTLRARSRDLTRNSPVGAGAVNTAVTSTVGTGLRLQSQVDQEILGLSDDEAADWQNRAERIWKIAGRQMDLEGELTQAQLQALAFRSAFDSGDVLVIRRYRERPGDLLGTKVQLVEADRVSNPRLRPDKDGMMAGVEYDSDGRTVAYHVADRHPGDLWNPIPGNWGRVPAWGTNGLRLSKLLFEKRRPGQRRGVPFLAPVIEQIKQITRLNEYELHASVVSALFTVFLTTADEDADADPDGGLPALPEGETEADVLADGLEEGDIAMNPGAVVDVGNRKPMFAKPERPSGAYDPFFRAILAEIGMALEIPFEVLLKQFQSSYSAARAALLEAWRFFKGRRQWLAEGFCQFEYELVITEAIARGLLEAPGFFEDPITRQAWLGSRWIGDAPGQVDPLKEVKAARERMEGLLSTIQEETAQLTGGDFDQNVREMRRERLLLEDAGITPAPRTPVAGEDDDPDAPTERGQAA